MSSTCAWVFGNEPTLIWFSDTWISCSPNLVLRRIQRPSNYSASWAESKVLNEILVRDELMICDMLHLNYKLHFFSDCKYHGHQIHSHMWGLQTLSLIRKRFLAGLVSAIMNISFVDTLKTSLISCGLWQSLWITIPWSTYNMYD